jgi:hypothetical protein
VDVSQHDLVTGEKDMALHSSFQDWRSASRTKVTGGLVLTFAFSAAVFGQTATTSTPSKSATLDAVNVGEDSPPGRLAGFGPPEPRTHGGSWGGAPTADFYRVLWFPSDQPFGVIEMKIPPHTVAKKLEIDYLNGISGCFGSSSGDTFAVYVANHLDSPVWTLIGTVVWDASACTAGEQERAVVLYLRAANNEDDEGLGGGSKGKGLFVRLGGGSKGKELFVRIVSAAGVADQPWALFNVFGQVGIHSVRLIGRVTHEEQ